MRQRRARKLEETELNITPMLDVVFIMLIFFIVTASFTKEVGLDVTRPDSNAPQNTDKQAILITVGPQNRIWIKDHGEDREIDIRAVRANVERLFAEDPTSGVVIRADPDSETGVVVRIMDAAKLANVPSVALADTSDQ